MHEYRIPCIVMRGGTSKALFFMESDLPADPDSRRSVLLSSFGSPDPRQIDGLGGADPLTSKLAIISPSTDPSYDINYTFGQVSITEPFIDFAGNCGNISSAVGVFAIQTGLVRAVEPVTTVRILNTNTKKMIVSEIPVGGGAVVTEGDFRVDGVPGTGAEIKLHFMDPGGVISGGLLPTGRPRDSLALEDGRSVDVSIVDAGNPTAFVRADQLGLRGDELPDVLTARTDVLDTMEEIRSKVSALLGLSASWRDAYRRYRTYPKIAMVAPAGDFQTIHGTSVGADAIDFQSRVLAMGRVHKALAITAAIPMAAAARITGSVVHEVARPSTGSPTLLVGHPSGIMPLGVVVRQDGDRVELKEVIIGRTARRLMEGYIYCRMAA
jgi:methylitaconate Delta-isomerase